MVAHSLLKPGNMAVYCPRHTVREICLSLIKGAGHHTHRAPPPTALSTSSSFMMQKAVYLAQNEPIFPITFIWVMLSTLCTLTPGVCQGRRAEDQGKDESAQGARRGGREREAGGRRVQPRIRDGSKRRNDGTKMDNTAADNLAFRLLCEHDG